MNIEKAFNTQQQVDNVIAAKMPADWGGMEGWKSLHHRKFAFRVEVMELANEIGFFKDWKHSHKVNVSTALEELADCIAFLLSVGITQKYNKFVTDVQAFHAWQEYTMEDLFDVLCDIDISNMGKFEFAFRLLIGIGLKIGATESDIMEAYLRKSLVNMERQENNY